MPKNAVIRRFQSLPLPEDYYRGKGQAPLTPPRNILLFYRDGFREKNLDLKTNFHYRCVLIFNGGDPIRMAVDGSLLDLDPGCFLLLLPYQYHRFIQEGRQDLSLLFITFEMEDPLPLLPMKNRALPWDSSVPGMLDRIRGIYGSGKEKELPLWTAILLTRLIGTKGDGVSWNTETLREGGELVSRICRLLYGDRTMTIRRLSRETGFSEGYLRSRFKERTGVTLGRYILESRLTEAMRYLTTTEKSVSEIAALAGYESLYSFSRSFRSHVGTSPRGYRKEHQPRRSMD